MASLRKLYKQCRSILHSGSRFFCPVCQKGARLFLKGPDGRKNARCPHCISFERHRLLWLVLQKEWSSGRLAGVGKLLHVAPEECLAEPLKKRFHYVSIDMDPRKAMLAMDITNLGFPDNSFNAIVCNHVLEHVQDDYRALSELFRVLRPGGWGSIQVPMSGEVTQEDSTITTPEERLAAYGQDDHVRIYGQDYLVRLRTAGFDVLTFRKEEIVNPEADERFSLTVESKVILAVKN